MVNKILLLHRVNCSHSTHAGPNLHDVCVFSELELPPLALSLRVVSIWPITSTSALVRASPHFPSICLKRSSLSPLPLYLSKEFEPLPTSPLFVYRVRASPHFPSICLKSSNLYPLLMSTELSILTDLFLKVA
ncbi:hypothetical protein RRG08_053392 [Elysia crispata]|uniref:Uncharacterized protein n=1 Tax=Elysia crispata TaxID=231223 RepID=A0AAE1B6Z9_9GAST|nr:hypothetical protein RRG08_053392 [Elysia crispata]